MAPDLEHETPEDDARDVELEHVADEDGEDEERLYGHVDSARKRKNNHTNSNDNGN